MRKQRQIEVSCVDCGKKRMVQATKRLPKRCAACSLDRYKREDLKKRRSPLL